MNSKFIGHYSFGLSLPFLKKLIIENQIFLQTYPLNETAINNGEDCNSIIFFPKITTGLVKSFDWFNQGSINHRICQASSKMNLLFILAFLICFGLFSFFWKQQNLIETAKNTMIIFVIIVVLVKMLEILIYGF